MLKLIAVYDIISFCHSIASFAPLVNPLIFQFSGYRK